MPCGCLRVPGYRELAKWFAAGCTISTQNEQKSVSVQDTKPTPHVQGARGTHRILETSIQFLWKRGHMPTHEDDLSRRLQSALERSRALRRRSQILGEMVQILKSESTEIHIEAKVLLSSLSQQFVYLTLSKKGQMMGTL